MEKVLTGPLVMVHGTRELGRKADWKKIVPYRDLLFVVLRRAFDAYERSQGSPTHQTCCYTGFITESRPYKDSEVIRISLTYFSLCRVQGATLHPASEILADGAASIVVNFDPKTDDVFKIGELNKPENL